MNDKPSRFAVFDIDGTLFRWQLFHSVVFELIESGHIPQEAKQDIDLKMEQWRNRSHRHAFHDYEMAVVHAFKPHLAGLKASDLTAAADTVLARSGSQVYTYTRDLIEKLRGESYTLIALSGSQDEIVQRFAKIWNFDIALGQAYDAEDGVYTGTIPTGRYLVEQKGDLLKKLVKTHNLSWRESVAVGDSLSDAGMLQLVEKPIAFNPDDQLFAKAKEHRWKVVVERKNMTYELEPHGSTFILA